MKTSSGNWVAAVVVVVAIGHLVAANAAWADVRVWQDAPSSAPPHDTWETAATNLQEAVTYAVDTAKSRVLVTNGTYYLTAAITNSSALTIESVNGAAVTTVDAQGVAGRRCFYLNHANAVVDGFTIRNGRGEAAPSDTGGGVYIGTAGGTLRSCVIEYNSAVRWGGGIYMLAGTVTNCIVRNNSLTNGERTHGGGIWMSGGLVVDSVISNNTINSTNRERGGGINMEGGTVDRSIIVHNRNLSSTAQHEADGGGGVYLSNAGATLRNSFVAGNQIASSKSYGGGVRISAGKIENCTIVRNYSPTSGGGVHHAGGTIVNTIVYHNNAASAPLNVALNASVTYSCAPELTSGTGNRFADPLLVDAGSGFGYTAAIGDYRLRMFSPCVDVGTTVSGITADIEDKPRPMDGNGDATAAFDIGAYEVLAADEGALRCDFTASPRAGVAPLTVTFTAVTAGSNTTITTYAWDVDGSGEPDISGSDKGVVSHIYNTPGNYTVSLAVTNSADEGAVMTLTAHIVVSSPIYVSPVGSHTSPFDSWATAATNIQAAVDIAPPGGLVLVTNGVYLLDATLTLSGDVTVRSVNGPEVTILDGQHARRVSHVNHLDAVLSGFTVRRGVGGVAGQFTAAGAGVYLGNGLVENCIIRNNRGLPSDLGNAEASSSHGGGVYIAAGTLRNCVIVGNQAGVIGNDHGGGVALAFGTIEHCTIMRNRASGTGGGVYKTGGTIVNSIIAGNRALGAAQDINTTNGVTYSCSPDLTSGDGNITTDPRVMNEGGGWGLSHRGGDFRLGLGSPGLDSGTTLAAVTADLDGAARPANGSGSGAAHDMGAYETQLAPDEGPLRAYFHPSARVGYTPFSPVFTAVVAGTNTSGVVYTWDFTNDGTTDLSGTDRQVVTNDYIDNTQWYTVKLTVENGIGETHTVIRPDVVQMHTDTAYFSPSGSHTPPFTSWGTAATRIQDAVDEVTGTNNPTAWLDTGSYNLSEYVGLGKPVTVRGREGASGTTLNASAVNNVRVLALRHAQAVVDGVTLTGGRGRHLGGGIVIGTAGGTLRNCIVEGNQTSTPIGDAVTGGGGIYMLGGLVTNCIVRNNSSSLGHMSYGGGIWMTGGLVVDSVITNNTITSIRRERGGGIYMTGGTVDRCRILHNRNLAVSVSSGDTGGGAGVAMYGASTLLRNSLIAGNQVYGTTADYNLGGGVRITAGKIENCTIVRNQSATTGGGVLRDGGTIVNTIMYDNASPSAPVNVALHANVTYSCAPELTSGDGNIAADPQFKDPGSGTGYALTGGDFVLQQGSLLIDEGAYAAWMDTAFDLAGNPRIIGSAVDIGAYEIEPPRGTLILLR